MSDFLSRVIARTLRSQPTIRPRISAFELAARPPTPEPNLATDEEVVDSAPESNRAPTPRRRFLQNSANREDLVVDELSAHLGEDEQTLAISATSDPMQREPYAQAPLVARSVSEADPGVSFTEIATTLDETGRPRPLAAPTADARIAKASPRVNSPLAQERANTLPADDEATERGPAPETIAPTHRTLAAHVKTRPVPRPAPALSAPTQAPKSIEQTIETTPSIQVTIGRVEVRAISTPPPAAPRASRKEPRLSLDDYLKRPIHRS
jgi:hypothetical protein